MELDPLLNLDHVPAKPPAANPSSGSDAPGSGSGAADTEDPVASLLGTTDEEPPSSARPPPPAAANQKTASGGIKAFATPEELQEELASLLLKKQLPQSTVTALQNLLRENASLKEKSTKLKSLLGRSAKAQRDAKNELEQMKKLHDSVKAENERLEKRLEVMASRPTHMELLADFETNFDRALLSIGGKGDRKSQQQSGGENAAESSSEVEVEGSADGLSLYEDVASPSRTSFTSPSNRSDSLLLTELNESKSRITHLESLNTAFQGRYNNLEQLHKSLLNEQQSTKNTLTNLQLELRMSRMETEHALRGLREKEAVVTEMQLEIDLVTRSAVDANKRAAEGLEAAQGAKSDKEYVDGLEAKVVALQEWALASTESKRLTSERCRGLEGRVKELEGVVKKLTSADEEGLLLGLGAIDDAGNSDLKLSKPLIASSASSVASSKGDCERRLWIKSSSLVVGAGMVGHALLELGNAHIEPYETVILRWKFDLTPGDLNIYFSVLKGICDDRKKQRGADACFRRRHVRGGGGGDVSGAFAVQNACTLVWGNEMSWVRPRTIKWTVEAVAIEWSD